jgi:hypothetical protein
MPASLPPNLNGVGRYCHMARATGIFANSPYPLKVNGEILALLCRKGY